MDFLTVSIIEKIMLIITYLLGFITIILGIAILVHGVWGRDLRTLTSQTNDEGEQWAPLRVTGPDIVVFGDAGTAWMVGDGPGMLPANQFPTLDNYHADLGVGLDFGPLGFYLAKSVGADDQPVTFHVRMGRRF